ncbi:MAG: hypothetical protein QXP42_02620 [Candidatus Micrarchaeia archaeon]
MRSYGILLLILILLAGCMQKEEKKPTPVIIVMNATQNATILEGCEAKSGINRDYCYLLKARDESAVEECGKIDNASLRDNCIYTFAEKDPKLCDTLSNASRRDSCMMDAAIRLNDSSYCSGIGNEVLRAKCIERFVEPPCKELEGYERIVCLASLGDIGKCEEAGAKIDSCYYEVALNNSNSSICGEISNDVFRHVCLSILGNITACDGLEYMKRDFCYEKFAEETLNESLCDKILTSTYSVPCYMNLAVSKKKPSLCAKPEREKDNDDCYRAVAFVTNVSVCANIKRDVERDLCRFDIAKSRNDPSVCNYLENNVWRDTCYRTIILTRQYKYDAEACGRVLNPTWKDHCYYENAVLNKNASICEQIEYYLTKQLCVRNAGG